MFDLGPASHNAILKSVSMQKMGRVVGVFESTSESIESAYTLRHLDGKMLEYPHSDLVYANAKDRTEYEHLENQRNGISSR